MPKLQFSSLNFLINSTFRKVFDIWSQDVVDVCLEMFNCVPAEQTVAMRNKAKFLKRVSNSNNMLLFIIKIVHVVQNNEKKYTRQSKIKETCNKSKHTSISSQKINNVT